MKVRRMSRKQLALAAYRLADLMHVVPQRSEGYLGDTHHLSGLSNHNP